MPDKEITERMNVLEELVTGMIDRMNAVETATAGELSSIVKEYKLTLNLIAEKIEISNKRYDHDKIQHHIDSLTKLVASVPRAIDVKEHHHHHFGAWSKSLITGVVVAFLVTSVSVGIALHLNNENDRLNSAAYNYWLVKAFYPDIAKTVETSLAKDLTGYTEKAEKAIAKQQAILAAQAEAEETVKAQKAARRKLDSVKAGK